MRCMQNMHAMHIGNLHFTQVRLLAELLRLRNVSAVADRLELSQPAVSHALAKLRHELGDPLFVRTGSGLEPTPFGQRLGAAAREAVDALLAGIASRRSFDPLSSKRQFRFYMSDVGQTVFLPRLAAHLKKYAPAVSIKCVPIPFADPGAGLRSGEVDLAVGIFNNLVTGFHQRFLFNEQYVCVVRTGHPDFRFGMSIEAFRSTQLAIADATGMAHAAVELLLRDHQLQREDTVRVPTFHVLPSIIAGSDMIAIVPRRLGAAVSQHMKVDVLPLPVAAPAFPIRMYWHDRYHHDPPIVWLRRVFVELFASRVPSKPPSPPGRHRR
jgi:DNA-binding transcriptional LysR family regulator